MSRNAIRCAEGATNDVGSGLLIGGAIGLLVGLLTGEALMVILIGAGVGLIFGPSEADE